MSTTLTQIDITLRIPVINDRVVIPNDKGNWPPVYVSEVLSAIPGSSVLEFGVTDIKKFIQLPAFDRTDKPASDYYKTIEDLALAKL